MLISKEKHAQGMINGGNGQKAPCAEVCCLRLFLLGLASAIAFRAIIIFQHLEPSWVRPVWYIGTAGYFLFFLYRYQITGRGKRRWRSFS